MRLKYYNLVIIVPVFFILGLLLTSFSFYIQKKEILNGLSNEVESVSKAISIFLEAKDIKKDLKSINSAFKKIVKKDRVKRLILSDRAKVLLKIDNTNLKDNYMDTKLLKIQTKGENILYSNIKSLKDKKYKLFVSIDASKEQNAIEGVLEQSFIIVAIMIILGIISSYILSLITSRNIDSLNKIANSIAAGDYKSHDKNYFIKEVSDLSNTLDIVKSILIEILHKTKNSILDTDYVNKNDELIKPTVVIDEIKSTSKQNISVAIAVNPKINQKEFYSCWGDDKYIYAFIGEFNSSSNYLKDYICISSISKLLKYYLNTNSFDMKKIKNMYDIKSIVVLKVDINSNEIFEHRLLDETISSENFSIEDNEVKTFYHWVNTNLRLKNYIEMYSHLEINQLVKDINRIFDKELAMIFIKKQMD